MTLAELTTKHIGHRIKIPGGQWAGILARLDHKGNTVAITLDMDGTGWGLLFEADTEVVIGGGDAA